MKMPKEMSEKSILRVGKKYHIPPEDSYQLDSTYRRYLFSLDTSKFKQQIKKPLSAASGALLQQKRDTGILPDQLLCRWFSESEMEQE